MGAFVKFRIGSDISFNFLKLRRIFLIIILLSFSITIKQNEGLFNFMEYTELYRPQYHFSPETGWMNDPNGLVYYDGEYHLFYQYTPNESGIPGSKSWGHAVSNDLVCWEHLPVALSPDSLGDIFSGSAVVDWQNTSGLQTGGEAVLVAIFTHSADGLQQQSIAYSNDRGRTWTKYSQNPVIPNPGLSDFRDPKVFWHAGTARWIMVLAAGDRVMLYTSPNLFDWRFSSQFGELEGAHGGVWECPDLFPLKVDGDPKSELWVLLVSVGGGAPNGGSGTQYFVGSFDGKTFTNHLPPTEVNWIDYGMDNYAGVTYSDIPEQDGRRILVGWMNNWRYADKIPTSPWRGAMTLPRALKLTMDPTGTPQLVSTPIQEFEKIRLKQLRSIDSGGDNLEGERNLSGNQPIIEEMDSQTLEVIAEIDPGTATQFGFRLKNTMGDQVLVGCDIKAKVFFIDRRNSGFVDFESDFGRNIHPAPYHLDSSTVQLQIFVDSSSIEVFGNGGRVVLTDQIFPWEQIDEVEFYTLDGYAQILKLDVWELATTCCN
jgi:fructan beta-fructosidase